MEIPNECPLEAEEEQVDTAPCFDCCDYSQCIMRHYEKEKEDEKDQD